MNTRSVAVDLANDVFEVLSTSGHGRRSTIMAQPVRPAPDEVEK